MQKTYDEGFRLTNDGEVLRIEPTKLQPKPLTLDPSALAEIGLGLREDYQLSYNPRKATRGENIIESFLTPLGLRVPQETPAGVVRVRCSAVTFVR